MSERKTNEYSARRNTGGSTLDHMDSMPTYTARTHLEQPFPKSKSSSPERLLSTLSVVPPVGVEPTWRRPREFESRLYTSFSTEAWTEEILHEETEPGETPEGLI